jgi:restriction endonuclease S subunit
VRNSIWLQGRFGVLILMCVFLIIIAIVFNANNDIITKYIQLYLSNNINLVQDKFKGSNHKHPTWTGLSKILIPIPPIEKQKEIIDYCDFNIILIMIIDDLTYCFYIIYLFLMESFL